jgi:hypothetical protein
VRLAIEAPDSVIEALRPRYGVFFSSGAPDERLVVTVAPEFRGDLALEKPRDFSAMQAGRVDAARDLGVVDAGIRLALSLLLPRRGAILLHASAVTRGLVFAGASGAGKSTAAAALGPALADELVVVRAGTVYGTPYWNGRAESVAIDRIVILERGAPAHAELTGSRAIAALSPHVVRYRPAADGIILDVLAQLSVRIMRAVCPTGDAFLPALRAILKI